MRAIIDFLLGWTGAPNWLLQLISYVAVTTLLFVIAPLTMMFLTWVERRGIAFMQDRLGPNRVGPAGLLQPIADGVKIFIKEDIVPDGADRWVHLLAPCVVAAPALLMFAVVPWGYGMVPTDLNVGLLFFVAVSSISAVGLMMAGWGSNNKFSLLGAMRAVAQMVSYEIPLLLSLASIVVLTGTLSVVSIVEAQGGGFGVGGWHIWTPVGMLGFVAFAVSALAEAERTPFDIPEAESEIVAGYMTEYSGMKFGLFYIANFLLAWLMCAMAATLFLGGWQGLGVNELRAAGLPVAASVLSLVYFLLKTYLLYFGVLLIRATWPRLRVDQLMNFGWKVLTPLALVNLLAAMLWVPLFQWSAAQGVGAIAELPVAVRWALAWVVTAAINVAGVVFVRWLSSQRRDEVAYELVARDT
jgi:NADH:ubiquinone oxidoreductase subunit H